MFIALLIWHKGTKRNSSAKTNVEIMSFFYHMLQI